MFLHGLLDDIGKGAQVPDLVCRLGDHLHFVVKNGTGMIFSRFNVRGIGRFLQRYSHLLCDSDKGVFQYF